MPKKASAKKAVKAIAKKPAVKKTAAAKKAAKTVAKKAAAKKASAKKATKATKKAAKAVAKKAVAVKKNKLTEGFSAAGARINARVERSMRKKGIKNKKQINAAQMKALRQAGLSPSFGDVTKREGAIRATKRGQISFSAKKDADDY